MKKITILVSFVMAVGFHLYAQVERNCARILDAQPASASGIYTIDPDGPGPKPSMECYCDMTTDGGGWTLVLNYNHLDSTSPSLKVFTDSLPLQGETSLGFDESSSRFWGHADTALMNAIPFDEVRFYGKTSFHSRVIHFKTAHAGTVSYFKTGLGSTQGISTSFTPYGDHSSYLPASIDMSTTDKGNYAMTDYPLWTGSTYHWFLAGSDPSCTSLARWEVDDYPCYTNGLIPSTLHQIWVRESGATGIGDASSSMNNLTISPNPASTAFRLNLVEGIQMDSKWEIFNSTGQLLRAGLVSDNSEEIQVADLSRGIYLIVVSSKEGIQRQKLIIER